MIDTHELRQSPLRAEHERSGAKFVEFGGWEMPLSYPKGTVAEHLACRSSAVAFDVSHLGTVRVDGRDAFSRLQESLTNDLRKISPGKAQYTHLLSDDGSVLDDIIVWWVDADRFDAMPNASNTDDVLRVLGGTDVTASRAIIAVQGPMARSLFRAIDNDAAEVAHFGVKPFVFHGVECLVAGTGYTGEDGIECAVPTEVAPSLWRVLIDVGVEPAGLGARDTLRLEAGLPLHGHELGPGITPLQAGLSWVVSFDKGPFIGRDALIAEKEHGIPRRLRGLLSSTRRPLHTGEACTKEDVQLGVITSGNFSPVLGRGIAFALLSPQIDIGEPIAVETRGGPVEAVVTKPPFHRLRSVESTTQKD